MGGGDLNMKKSWHPLLMKNQERVWLEEKKALEEKKKLDQLRKEKEEERQLQELQRLQEEQTGRKRTEKLEWMYATPATGSNANKNELEDYLLGKKRVDKLLTGDENEKIGASHKDFIAVQNANTVRDIAAKIREDPLLAIKQQEQAALQQLKSNPLRLKELKAKMGIEEKDKKDKEKKKEKRSRKEKRREYKDRDDRDRYDDRRHSHSRSRSPNHRYARRRDERSPPRRSRVDDYERKRNRSPEPRRYSRSRSFERYRDGYKRRREDDAPRYRPRSRSPRGYSEKNQVSRYPRSDETSSEERRSRSGERQGRSEAYDRKRDSASSSNKRARLSPPPRRRLSPPPRPPQSNGYSASAEERAVRLAAMTQNATSLTAERKEHLTELLATEKAEAEEEEKARARSGGMGSFLSAEQKKVFTGASGIEERIRRGRAGLVVDAD